MPLPSRELNLQTHPNVQPPVLLTRKPVQRIWAAAESILQPHSGREPSEQHYQNVKYNLCPLITRKLNSDGTASESSLQYRSATEPSFQPCQIADKAYGLAQVDSTARGLTQCRALPWAPPKRELSQPPHPTIEPSL